MTRPLLTALLLALLLVLQASGPLAAKEASPTGHFLVRARVIRLDLEQPERAKVLPLDFDDGRTTRGWSDLLAALSAAGRVTLLLDQQVTAQAGAAAEMKQTRTRWVEQFQRRDLQNETWIGSALNEGCQVHVVCGETHEYAVEVDWLLAREGERSLSEPQQRAVWKGRLPEGAGTLVLHQAAQVQWREAPMRGVVLYVLLEVRAAGR